MREQTRQARARIRAKKFAKSPYGKRWIKRRKRFAAEPWGWCRRSILKTFIEDMNRDATRNLEIDDENASD